MHTTTVGAFARRLLTVAELDLYGTPLPPVGPILEYRFSVHLAAHDDVAKRAVVNKSKLGTASLQVGASGFLCCARDFYSEDEGAEDAIVPASNSVNIRNRLLTAPPNARPDDNDDGDDDEIETSSKVVSPSPPFVRFVAMERVGHCPHEEDPETFATVALTFLKDAGCLAV